MSWVIMTYSGNHLGDKGSRYTFDLYGKVATGINNVNAAKNSPVIYSIDGKRVDNTRQKGIYIIRHDGKTSKVVK